MCQVTCGVGWLAGWVVCFRESELRGQIECGSRFRCECRLRRKRTGKAGKCLRGARDREALEWATGGRGADGMGFASPNWRRGRLGGGGPHPGLPPEGEGECLGADRGWADQAGFGRQCGQGCTRACAREMPVGDGRWQSGLALQALNLGQKKPASAAGSGFRRRAPSAAHAPSRHDPMKGLAQRDHEPA